MKLIGQSDLAKCLPWPIVIDAIAQELRLGRVDAPERQVLEIQQPDGSMVNLLIMPAWIGGEAIGVKLVTFFPQNNQQGRSAINASYVLFDGKTGQLDAVLEGDELTARRTAAASALAAKHLARENAARLLIVGTGQLSHYMAKAHLSVRTYTEVRVFGRDGKKAEQVVADLNADGVPAELCRNLQASCGWADVISCATAAKSPVIKGKWLGSGVHLDLVGSFKADMRESDDDVVRTARIFVDSRDGAIKAGDLAQPIADGVIGLADIAADLADLVCDVHPGRQNDEETTLFKSAGFSLEDLAAARLAVANSAETSS